MESLSSTPISKNEKITFLSKYFNYIEAIRHNNGSIDKTNLKNITGVAWPTLEKAINEFSTNNSAISADENKRFLLKNSYSIHAGISIGATQVKLYICDLGYNALTESFFSENGITKYFEELKEDDIREKQSDRISKEKTDWTYFCYNRENTVEGISSRLKKIIEILLNLDKVLSNVLSIGISFPGIINTETLGIDFSPNIRCLRNIHINDLISKDLWEQLDSQGITVSYEHDTQAASIYEKEMLFSMNNSDHDYSNDKNICCIYIAAGIGASFIVNNRLCRGTTNSFGELGHTPAPELLIDKISDELLPKEERFDKYSYDYMKDNIINKNEGEISEYINEKKKEKISKESSILPCECGKYACLESALRRNVFDAYDIESYLEKINRTDELSLFYTNHPYRYRVLKEYIGYIVGLIINFLNPDLIIFSGRVMQDIRQIENDLNPIKANSAIGIPAFNCQMILGSKNIYSAAAGTAISSLHNLIKGKSFSDISW